MATPRLLLRCGCEVAFDHKASDAPLCPTHGQQSVVRVVGMPKPRIRGTAIGPLVTTVDLPAWTGPLTGSDS